MKILLLLLLPIPFFLFCQKDFKKSSPNTDKKIIIIGAGVAGLSAGKYFKDNGIEVSILEAQDVIGGRVKSNRSLGLAFDEGASWIHGHKGNPIAKIARNAGATTFWTDDENVVVYDVTGQKYTDKALNKAEKKFNSILSHLNGDKKQSFGDAFYQQYPQYKDNRLLTYMLSAYLEFDTGADIFDLSSLDFYNDEAFSGDDLLISNGYDRIPNYLAKGLDVKLNTKVLEVHYAKDMLLIRTTQGDFFADYVLVTVPLGVLKKGSIKFTPPLPKKTQKAIDHLEMGTVNKFLLVWDSLFWDETLQYIGFTPKIKGKFNYFLNLKKYSDSKALMTFAFGDFAKETEKMTNQQVTKEIMSHLKLIYGNDIPNPSKMLRTKWNSNPFAFGSYSYATNNTSTEDFEVFESPVNNKVFFAGEHTIRDYRGTVHGAYLSGRREAKKIMEGW